MNPPKHIMGRLNGRSTPAAVRMERDQWVASQARAGQHPAAVGEALGISEKAARDCASRAGCTFRDAQRVIGPGQIRKHGLNVGVAGEAIFAMPEAVKVALIKMASQRKCSLVKVLADEFAKAVVQ